MSDILEKITSSNIIFFSIIGVLIIIIIIMIVLIRKENKNKLNDILDQSKAIKVLDENEITDTVAIPNINLEESGVITIPSLDDNVNKEIENVNDVNLEINNQDINIFNDVNVDVNNQDMNSLDDFNSGATINDTISLPKIDEDEIIEPIINPFDVNIEKEDLKTLGEIDSFTKEIELPSLKDDFVLPVSNDFELPSLKEDNDIELPNIVNEEVDKDVVIPEVNVPLVEESVMEIPKIEKPVIDIELPQIVSEEIDYPDTSVDEELPKVEENADIVLPVEEEVILPELNIDSKEERVKIDVPEIDFSPIEVELVNEEPVIKEDVLPVINIKEDDDEDDGKYEYDEDIEEEEEGIPLSELTEGEVTDDNLVELANRLEERTLPDVVKLTSYEEKQEEEAIISYDELLSKTDSISIEKNEKEMEEQAIDIRDINDDNYSYEEDFLSSLKDLRDSLK